MDRLISIVECQPSASTSTSEIDETILQECLHKIPIWDIAKMSKESFQQFPGNQKTILTSSYCQAMNARFDGEFFSFCLVWSGLKKNLNCVVIGINADKIYYYYYYYYYYYLPYCCAKSCIWCHRNYLRVGYFL